MDKWENKGMKYKTSGAYILPGLLNELTAKIKDFNPNQINLKQVCDQK